MTTHQPEVNPDLSSDPQLANLDLNSGLPPKLNLFTMFRLGLFQMGLGMMSLLTLGVLNRVLINGMEVPAVIAASAIAMHQFMSPARVWFGQMSDSKRLFGLHRSGYVWIGAAIFVVASFVAVQVTWQLGDSINLTSGWQWTNSQLGWAGVLAFVFAIYGLALSSSSTPFAALLVDISDEEDRSKLVGVVWSMLMVGIVIGAILSSSLLKEIANDTPVAVLRAAIDRLFLIVPSIVFGLALLATVGVEKKYSRFHSRTTLVEREDKITLGRALRVLTASRQTGLFFAFLLIMTTSLFMQEPILEPFGGEVFQMTYAETTRINAFWGTGTLIGLSATSFFVVPRLGKQATTKFGCFAVAGCFGAIILAGFTHNPAVLNTVMFVFGLASGVVTSGAISLMLDLTAAETAGTFIGAWGLAQAMARGIATVAGGLVLDLGRKLFSMPELAYGLVFALQAIGMIGAVVLLSRVNVQEFRVSAKQAIDNVIASNQD